LRADIIPWIDNPAEEDSRVYFAAERTFLAWIPTGLELMGGGFAVNRFRAHVVGGTAPLPAGSRTPLRNLESRANVDGRYHPWALAHEAKGYGNLMFTPAQQALLLRHLSENEKGRPAAPSTWQLRSQLLYSRTIGTKPIRMASRRVEVSRRLEELVLSIESRILPFRD
jgi:Domain of unknown function (DUF202)